MKFFIFLILCSSFIAFADEVKKVETLEPINVDGYVKEQKVEDPELAGIQAEIQKQKQEVILNKKKTQSFKELSKSVEKLSETTEEYLEEKRAAKEEIANYNAKVKCLQSEAPGAECDKYLRRR
jgi:septal ring factor EnvC (AmiA/AmiB activator)